MAKIEERSSFTRAIDLSFSASREYLPIAEHGVIGDLHTVALVGTDGTIDWYCCPRFDSPSVFAAILDTERGGYYRIAPALGDRHGQAALLPGHERPDHALPHADGRGRGRGLHADRRRRRPAAARPPRRLRARASCASGSRSSRASTTAGRARDARDRAGRRLRLPELTLSLATSCRSRTVAPASAATSR